MAPCVLLHTTNKIKLEVPESVNKCHVVHTDMAGGIYVHLEFHMLYAAPGVPCLGDSSDKSRGIHLRAVFMTAFIVYPEAIIRGRYYKDHS